MILILSSAFSVHIQSQQYILLNMLYSPPMSPFVSQCQNVILLFRCTYILKSNFSMPVKTSHLVFRAFLDPKVLLLSMCLDTHSSVLAWKIPWMEKPGRLQSVGSHRVGHDWSDLAAAAACALITVLKFRQETTRCKDSLSHLNLKVLCPLQFFNRYEVSVWHDE